MQSSAQISSHSWRRTCTRLCRALRPLLTPLCNVILGVIGLSPSLFLSLQAHGLHSGNLLVLQFFYDKLGVFGATFCSHLLLPLVSVGLSHSGTYPNPRYALTPRGPNGQLPASVDDGRLWLVLVQSSSRPRTSVKKYPHRVHPKVGMLGIGEPLMYAVTPCLLVSHSSPHALAPVLARCLPLPPWYRFPGRLRPLWSADLSLVNSGLYLLSASCLRRRFRIYLVLRR